MSIPPWVWIPPLAFGLLLYLFLWGLDRRGRIKRIAISLKEPYADCRHCGLPADRIAAWKLWPEKNGPICTKCLFHFYNNGLAHKMELTTRPAIRIVVIASLLFMMGCTAVYGPDGKKRFQTWDAQGLAYSQTPEGAVSLQAASVSASQTILAIGKAATPAVMAVGATAAMNATTSTVKAVRAPLLPR